MRPFLCAALVMAASSAHADVCDFRPSILAGKAGEMARSTAGTVVTATAEGVRAMGAYTLENPVSGASMISTGVTSATAAGTSLVTGASGALTTASAIVTAPVTIAVAGLTAVALGGYEGACYLRDDRITDYVTLKGRNAIAGTDKVRIASAGVGPFIFDVKNLYIADGVLMHRDMGRNTVIGNVALQVIAAGH